MAKRVWVPLPSLGCAAEAEVEGWRVLRLRLRPGSRSPTPRSGAGRALARDLERWLRGWGSGRWKADPILTPFQRRVLCHVATIPRGETRTYGDVARALGTGARAVGQALGANPVPLFIPCHRVVASDGIGGFSGPGVGAKRRLLRLEGAALGAPNSIPPSRKRGRVRRGSETL